MKGVYLRFYMNENRKLHGILAHEWLLEKAKSLGIAGGSAFRAIAGFGRDGVLREDHFFEMAGDLPVEVAFALTAAEARRLLQALEKEKTRIFYVRTLAEFGSLNGKTKTQKKSPRKK